MGTAVVDDPKAMVLDGPAGPPTTGALPAIEVGGGPEVTEGEVVGIDVGTVAAAAGPVATTVWPVPPDPTVEGFDKAVEGPNDPAKAVDDDSDPAEDGLCAVATPCWPSAIPPSKPRKIPTEERSRTRTNNIVAQPGGRGVHARRRRRHGSD